MVGRELYRDLARREKADAGMVSSELMEVLQQMAGGLAVVPVIAAVIDLDVKAVGSCGLGSEGAEIVARQKGNQVRLSEGGVVRLRCFFELRAVEVSADDGGESERSGVSLDDLAAVSDRGRVWKRGAGADGVKRVAGDVGDQKGALCCVLGGDGEAASFDAREVFSQRVHSGDREAGVHERLVEGGDLFEGESRVERLFHHSRRASADEEEDEAMWVAEGEHRENGLGGELRVGAGNGVLALEELKVSWGRGWGGGSDDDAFQGLVG